MAILKATKTSFVLLALSPLAPALALMWAAKGIQSLQEKSRVSERSSETPKFSWEMDTIYYAPTS